MTNQWHFKPLKYYGFFVVNQGKIVPAWLGGCGHTELGYFPHTWRSYLVSFLVSEINLPIQSSHLKGGLREVQDLNDHLDNTEIEYHLQKRDCAEIHDRHNRDAAMQAPVSEVF